MVLVIAIIFCLTGFCSAFNVSPLLSCMVLGTVYINVSGNKALFKPVSYTHLRKVRHEATLIYGELKIL